MPVLGIFPVQFDAVISFCDILFQRQIYSVLSVEKSGAEHSGTFVCCHNVP